MSTVSFGQWMKSRRQHMGLTQYDVEHQTGIARSHLSAMENNRINLPDEETRAKIHGVLDTTEDDLVAVGILERLESPVPGGGPVYINPSSIRRDRLAYPPERMIADAQAADDALQGIHTAIDAARLTTGQLAALTTILEAFRAQNGIPE